MQINKKQKSFFRLHRYNQVAAIFMIISNYSVKKFIMKILSLNNNHKVTSEKCGTETIRNILARPNFSTRSQADLNFHIARNHSLSQSKNVHNCQLCHQVFAGLFFFRIYKKVFNAQRVSDTKNVDVTQLVGEIDG